MTNASKLLVLKEYLDTLYPETHCFLNHNHDYELLFAVLMSAQSQDVVVNKVTEVLFSKYPTLESLSKADPLEIQQIIQIVGLAKTKAHNIVASATKIMKDYQGVMPKTKEELTSLPGVGNKTASVVLGELYNERVFPVDTHVMRVMKRLGIATKKDDPTALEVKLLKCYPYPNTIHFHRQIILFGRNICHASNKRKCDSCPLPWCKERLVKVSD